VLLRLDHGNPWVYGALVNNIWSVTDSDRSPPINQMTLQPFVNYNFPGGTYLTSSPIVTANWRESASEAWTVPIGGGVGQIVHVGRLPLNLQLSAYYNVVTPETGADWQLRFQIQFLLPKSIL
jgi:hypothetical protein